MQQNDETDRFALWSLRQIVCLQTDHIFRQLVVLGGGDGRRIGNRQILCR